MVRIFLNFAFRVVYWGSNPLQHIMAQSKRKMNGKFYYFPDRVTLEKRNGKQRIAVGVKKGTKLRKYFPATEKGLNEACEFVAHIRQEEEKYGRDFGTISEDEKKAIDLWRQYKDACVQEGCEYKSMEEVMRVSLNKILEVSISPTMNQAAKIYLDDMKRRNNDESTPHMITVENRLRHITDAMGEVHLCNITDAQITDFLGNLRHPQTGKSVKATTRKQYLDLIKSVFKLVVKRGLMEEKKNIARTIDAPKIKRIEPETLSLDEVCKVFEYVRDNPKEHRFIPVLAVGFFCGPRVAERCRLRYKDIFVGGRDVVYLSCEITKTNRDRHTYTNANFKAWMDFAREHGVKMEANSYLLPGDTEEKRKDAHNRLLKRIAEATGVAFPKNCIRHTAATNMTELQGFTSTANQLGHGEGMLANNYRIAITRDEATAYFNISPTCCDADKLLSQAREQ